MNRTLSDYNREAIADFFKAIESNAPGYKHSSFGYFALRKGEIWELTQGRLLLQGVPPGITPGCFESENIRAGVYWLATIDLTPVSFIDGLLSGTVRTPQGDFQFPPDQGGSHRVFFDPFHSDGGLAQHRQVQLIIRGGPRMKPASLSLDWELRGAPTPYDNTLELCSVFQTGIPGGDALAVEITAFNVAVVGAESSIKGSQANFVVNLVHGLDREKTSIGYRVLEKNLMVQRGSIPGSRFSWTNIDSYQRGEAGMGLPAGAIVHCIACYEGEAQHHFWMADPATSPNPLRSVYQSFDCNFAVLSGLIASAQTRGANARDLEIAVSWLLWTLGFSPIHLGVASKLSEGPDIIVATPQWNLMVVECTTGILKEDNKLAHVVERAEKVRQSFFASGNQHLKVLPVIVSTKTRDELKADLEQAYRLGVLVVTREDFPDLLNRTIIFPDANRLFAEAEETLRSRQSQLPPIL